MGSDGVPRLGPGTHSFLVAARGSWVDAETFVLEYDEIANLDFAELRVRFEGDRLTGEAWIRTRDARVHLEG
jgi:hypothetical protein